MGIELIKKIKEEAIKDDKEKNFKELVKTIIDISYDDLGKYKDGSNEYTEIKRKIEELKLML